MTYFVASRGNTKNFYLKFQQQKGKNTYQDKPRDKYLRKNTGIKQLK
jgi:hypothetical protein